MNLSPHVVFRPVSLYAALLCVTLSAAPARSQIGDPTTPRVHAFTNARIVTAPGRVIASGTLVIRDGVIEAVGAGVAPPADARIWPSEGFTIHPGFIDPYVPVPAMEASRTGGAAPRAVGVPAGAPVSRAAGGASAAGLPEGIAHENPKVRPERNAADELPLDAGFLAERRRAGFTTGNLARSSGIFRGASSVLGFGSGDARRDVIRARFAQVVDFETAGWDSRQYPGSLMGAIALTRQTLSDADGHRLDLAEYARGSRGRERPEANEALAALEPLLSGSMPALFTGGDYQNFLRADRVAAEFRLNALIVGSGHEYKRLDAIKRTGRAILLPVDFPPPPELKDDEAKRSVDIQDLRHWALAPGNPKTLDDAGVTFAFTAHGLDKPGTFRAKVAEAIARGLDADRALAACTTVPAALLGIADIAGTLEAGKVASFFIADGPAFADETKIQDVWVDGRRFPAEDDESDGAGKGRGKVDGSGTADASPDTDLPGILPDPEHAGRSADDAAAALDVTETPADTSKAGAKIPAAKASLAASRAVAPAGLMGDSEAWHAGVPLEPAAVLVRNGTIWTSGPQGRLDGADLLIRNGKIAAVGKDLRAPADAVVVDATGRHVTPGLIDCHSHTAVSGSVNEGTNSITAEVRIGDVVNAETIHLYRELAGGLTTVNLLHGSANAIGGQNQVIKMRYGMLAEELKFEGAMPGIKFALGENPKQSNWGTLASDRYPKSRMGVEELIRERFLTAADYRSAWADFKAGKGKRPRRDLQLEAIQEILDGKRLIHSHAYRQDEILMLIRLCERFGVTIGTFQHVLEGYKVADEIAAHGAGASSFSDWWTYKFEVYDAIPYSGALMTERGAVVSFNSDSSELARRMNTEAAKAVKYGGMTETEALKLVTLNPAIQLHVDDRVGSLEPGKDADFVVWSGPPLSNLTRCEQTWVDGRRFFDRAEDLKNRDRLAAERAALIEWAGKAKSKEKAGPLAERRHPGYLHGHGDGCLDEDTPHGAGGVEP